MKNEKRPYRRTQRLLCALVVVFLLAFMAVPAFAAENEYVLKAGTYRLHTSLTAVPYEVLSLPMNDEGYQFMVDNYGFDIEPITFVGDDEFAIVSRLSPFNVYGDLYVEGNPDYSSRMAILGYLNEEVVYGYLVESMVYGVEFSIASDTSVPELTYQWVIANTDYETTYMDTFSSGLTAVIDWVGSVVNALFSGEFSGLLTIVAIPVAVTLLVLAIYFIRRSIWGA